ncbi:polysaccharide deacetylase family protein [Halobacillus litoralis]|uniref:polysaccharide deacetylase family protein n=1 Tax=Halobacillus litoralis TaxID=45668 RepID=UPI001CFD4A83|nr:polysaccharide deacetylase family protein [Halobacillus litoralis]
MRRVCSYSVFVLILFLLFPSCTHAMNHPRHFYEEKGKAIWDVPTHSKYMAITFDDGPSIKYTPEILKILEEYDARATFFVVGTRVQQNPELIRAMVESGHELANHTFHHPNFTGITKEEIIKEIDFTSEVIEDITGVPPKLFRPPGGVYNDIIVDTANEEGYMVVMWSWHQDTKDWQSPGVPKIVNTVLSNAKNGDIILFHDFGGNRSQTVKALKQILPELIEEGYQFVTVSELIQKHVNYRILNGFGE